MGHSFVLPPSFSCLMFEKLIEDLHGKGCFKSQCRHILSFTVNIHVTLDFVELLLAILNTLCEK